MNRKSTLSCKNPIYPIITDRQQQALDSAIRLTFIGDLILLRPQVYNGYDAGSGKYDYSSLFHYTEQYFKESDFSIGVFEGPTAGEDVEYSTSAFRDGIPLHLNFPDSFTAAIRNAGIKYVTTANNHLLDRGVAGALRTLDVLDRSGLLHSGSYRDSSEKDHNSVFVVDVKGLKIALLTYTYGSSGYRPEYFLDPANAHITSILIRSDSELFSQIKQNVLDDFAKARAMHPDCIVVLPHMGGQFRHSPDLFQLIWCDIFVEAGADIIFSNHSHAVQPVEYRDRPDNRGKCLLVHCPGNYVDSYTDMNADASAIVEAYLDPNTGKPFAAAIIPKWTHSPSEENYRALPIYDILHDSALRSSMSTYEMERVRQVHSLVTSVMLGCDLGLDQVQKRYYLFPQGFVRNKVEPLEISDRIKDGRLYPLLENAKTVCFVGDSVTAGTSNGGYGWYEPMVAAFPHLTVFKRAWAGSTSKMMLEKLAIITNEGADLWVIAVGTNDVRYRDPERCAMTSLEYIENIHRLVMEIKQKYLDAKFVFLGAWLSDHYDPVSKLEKEDRVRMTAEYRESLRLWARDNGYLYIDPNPALEAVFKTRYIRKWLKDHIHPNASDGIRLYSEKVLECS